VGLWSRCFSWSGSDLKTTENSKFNPERIPYFVTVEPVYVKQLRIVLLSLSQQDDLASAMKKVVVIVVICLFLQRS